MAAGLMIWTSFLIIFPNGGLFAALPLNPDELIALNQNRADVALRDGSLRFTLETTSPERPQAEIEEIRSEQNKAIEALSDALRKRGYKGELTVRKNEEVATQYASNKVRLTDHHYRFSGPEVGGDRRFEFFQVDASGAGGFRELLLRRTAVAGKALNLRAIGHRRFEIGDLNRVVGIQSPHLAGRIQGLLGQEILNLNQVRNLVVADLPTTDPDLGRLMELKCEVEVSQGLRKILVVYAPDAGYVTPLVRELDAAEEVMREWICSGFVKASESSLWFPQDCRCQVQVDPQSRLYRLYHYRFTPHEIKFNSGIYPEELFIRVPAASLLSDVRDSKDTTYIATCDLDLNLDNVENLDSHACLHVNSVPENPVRIVEDSQFDPTPFIVGNFTVLVIFLIIMWRRRQRPPLLVTLLLIPSFLGCEPTARVQEGLGSRGNIEVPPVVNVGSVLAGEPISVQIRLRNRSDKAVDVAVTSSCGCMSIDEKHFGLAPFQQRLVGFRLFSPVRGGSFENTVTFDIADSESKTRETFLRSVLICGESNDKWRILPRHLLLTDKSTSAYLTITSTRRQWEGVSLVCSRSLSFVEVRSVLAGDFMTREFRVSSEQESPRSQPCFVTLVRMNDKAELASIPVFCQF